ncbi:hypothetical protein THAOC_16068 [Thalassiosira oceanica]|uniref:Cystinosin n=1 Tax=Thalassiosira oceanica TaxID=159749 RepID=K0SQH7_THAOC|nr:hypothetical protein THAOC_16068 [Thalassiosira oceanica]|eukprot:EJK63286.1 hypothetical protein THAOC_16068 [Thalassiosira oceanica]
MVNGHRDRCWVTWPLLLISGGVSLGAVLPKNENLVGPWKLASNVIGYIYFLAWSASFYPQIILNYTRRTTRGLSVDFCALNVLGYVCYSTYTASFYWNESIQRDYKLRMSGSGDGDGVIIQSNDVAFAAHALMASLLTLTQIGCYDSFRTRPPSKRVQAFLIFSVVFCLLFITVTGDVLGLLFVLGAIKVSITVSKYIPQVLLNYQRKSTVGWNVQNVLLDLTGGILSFVQLYGDCANMKNWGGFKGNFAKVMISLITIGFDIIFLIQHYVMYPECDEHAGPYTQVPQTGKMES